MRVRSAITAGGVSRPGLASWSSFLVAIGIGRGLRTHIRSSGTGGACGSRVAARGGSRSGGILDLGGQRRRPPRSIVGTQGVHFRPGQSVVIPGSGHYCLEEAPEEVAAALTAFLAPYRD
jgi:pimeloyl-ACP methyl ester carboxylesterase